MASSGQLTPSGCVRIVPAAQGPQLTVRAFVRPRRPCRRLRLFRGAREGGGDDKGTVRSTCDWE